MRNTTNKRNKLNLKSASLKKSIDSQKRLEKRMQKKILSFATKEN